MEPLLNCPFCGGEAFMLKTEHENRQPDYVVKCSVCEAQRLPGATPQEATSQWNTRRYQPPMTKVLPLGDAIDEMLRLRGHHPKRKDWKRQVAPNPPTKPYSFEPQ